MFWKFTERTFSNKYVVRSISYFPWYDWFNRSSYIIVVVLLVVHQIFLEIKPLWLKICLLYGVLTQRPSTLKICYVNISGVYNKQLNMAKVVYLHDVLSFISKRNCFMKLWWHALLLMWYLNLSRMVGYMRVLFCSYI